MGRVGVAEQAIRHFLHDVGQFAGLVGLFSLWHRSVYLRHFPFAYVGQSTFPNSSSMIAFARS